MKARIAMQRCRGDAAAVARGEIRDDLDVERLALLLSGLCELAVSLHWGAGDGWPALDEIPELLPRLFLEGARARDVG